MGSVSWSKHSRSKIKELSHKGTQNTLSSYSHVKKTDIQDYLLPVIKEVGKALFPPAAIAIEVLYQLYTHADSVKEVASAVMEGDYKKASVVVGRETVKEVANKTLGVGEGTIVTNTSSSLTEAATRNMKNDTQKKITGDVVKGSVKGVAEAVNKQIVDRNIK